MIPIVTKSKDKINLTQDLRQSQGRLYLQA